MRDLFRQADKNMYVDKNRAKMLEAAEKHLELAISAFKEDGGKTDTHYSAALAGLGEVCYRQGSLERSLENY